jgi:hypothetical protein
MNNKTKPESRLSQLSPEFKLSINELDKQESRLSQLSPEFKLSSDELEKVSGGRWVSGCYGLSVCTMWVY